MYRSVETVKRTIGREGCCVLCRSPPGIDAVVTDGIIGSLPHAHAHAASRLTTLRLWLIDNWGGMGEVVGYCFPT